MADISTVAENIREAQGYFYEKVSQAPLLSLPGVNIRTGVSSERIDLITPTISLTSGRKSAITSKTSAALFSQNELSPEIYEEAFDLPIHAIRKTSFGQYGGDDNGAFLESPEWTNSFVAKYIEKLDVRTEEILVAALVDQINDADTQFDGTRTTLTLVAPTTQAIAVTNINNLHAYLQEAPKAFRTGGGNKFLAMNDTDSNTLLRSFALANNFHLVPIVVDNATVYDIPFSDVQMVVLNGLATGQSFIFDSNNVVIKMASDFKMGYFERDDQLWMRPRVWAAANFAFFQEITTTIASS